MTKPHGMRQHCQNQQVRFLQCVIKKV
uniref:Uncharacterized protein n=1 Tax=Lepeophtheirus salmonis TaxID=72036 RepID=A0A0K2USF6_LEPSM